MMRETFDRFVAEAKAAFEAGAYSVEPWVANPELDGRSGATAKFPHGVMITPWVGGWRVTRQTADIAEIRASFPDALAIAVDMVALIDAAGS